jgi:hypothetical protein
MFVICYKIEHRLFAHGLVFIDSYQMNINISDQQQFFEIYQFTMLITNTSVIQSLSILMNIFF